MSATSAPFGLRPAYHPSGLDRAREYPMLAAYATPIYKNSPVALDGNNVNLASTAADFLGSFDGVTYTDVTGKPTVSNFWPGALTGATNITAWVIGIYFFRPPILRMSCSSCLAWITLPEPKNIRALKKAWVIR